ncbi:hypothetical protein [Parasulfitobacter algicola]|uniref:YcxB-like protein domain-containing protein n=1 Tax=Parasulfitobacter algicola TaxID=2614809 RepID=A0ABX2ISW3_9RHOB|nr:hypothetical protein [Sulfitobacter algicola]NSX53887.1 hypothetical protein [Sulfitobacter algicola]
MNNKTAEKIQQGAQFIIEDEDWGFIIRGTSKSSLRTTIAQVSAWITATLLFLAALGLWIAPAISAGQDIVYIKAGASIFFVTIGILLLSYSVRGTKSEFHFDDVRHEAREVIVNRSGAPTELTCYDFQDLDGVTIRRLNKDKKAETLLLSYKNGMHFVPVISGDSQDLIELKKRVLMHLGERETPKVSLKSTGQTKKLFGEKIMSNAA